jgi:membrane protein implicated in regulation of membrane protease activity
VFHLIVLADVVDWWGISLPQTLLLVSLILILVDVFFQEDQATHMAYILGAIAVALWVPVQPLYRILIGLVAWGALVYLHYAVWRQFVSQFVNRVVAPTRYRSGVRGLLGEEGRIREIQGRSMLCLHGDLWTYECDVDLPEGAIVRVVGERNGELVVEPIQERS